MITQYCACEHSIAYFIQSKSWGGCMYLVYTLNTHTLNVWKVTKVKQCKRNKARGLTRRPSSSLKLDGQYTWITSESVRDTEVLEMDWGCWVIGSGSSSASLESLGSSSSWSSPGSGSSCSGEEDLNSSTGVWTVNAVSTASAACPSGRNSLTEGTWHLCIHKAWRRRQLLYKQQANHIGKQLTHLCQL